VRIAIVVLVFTQLMNLVLVPHLAHAGLALAIGLGALLNAGWLLVGLVRRGAYTPRPGWARFGLQVVASSALLAIFLLWAGANVDWVNGINVWRRILTLAAMVLGAVVVYFGVLVLAGVQLRQFVRK
jgi:putative peptidoglycan lipid II flippase